ncbi:hypothetical protein HK099_005761 [Clydaea vesicula]|uniref:Glutaredoxin domain-containing protein n=1 Tax=Clydaea vesicula TaxID=447962 RepID=A0AAD5TYN9_9FUNG|nr:hypothetical protein HK099_005761 [Clydaea vesicula]KAJ3391973.1 hypothetical protein HDU92_008696 [Lobulomyces angularis]
MASAEVQKIVKDLINSNKVVVFSKSYCPYCKATKQLLTSLKIQFALLELDQVSNGSSIQDYIEELTGQRTVPNTFINGKSIGGNDKLQALNSSGQLTKLLQD